jgi:hypothetical protein
MQMRQQESVSDKQASETKALMQLIAMAQDEVARGEVITAEEAFKSLRERLTKRTKKPKLQ